MAVCLSISGSTLVLTDPQPATTTSCTLVAITGTEAQALNHHQWTLEEVDHFLSASALVLGTALIFRFAIQFLLNRN